MAIVVTEPPRLNSSERSTWQALVDVIDSRTTLVIPGQRVTDHLKDHEVDFVVAIEGAGILCLEIKGGEVWHDGEGWRQIRGGREHTIEPVRQARQACYALRDFIEKDPRWTQGRVRWDHVVVLPNTELPADFDLPDCPRWKVIDRNDLSDLVVKLRDVLLHQQLDRPLLAHDGIDQLSTALSGRGLSQRDIVARALANSDAADALTEHQAVILDAIRQLNRVEVRGGAGSGKTFLAMEQARRLAQRGQRVALVCYSHGLASYLERIAATWPRRQRPAYVGEFHALGVLWGAPEGPDESLRTDETVQFWERVCHSKWPIWQCNSNPAIASTPWWSTRPRTSLTPGGIHCWRHSTIPSTAGCLCSLRRGPARLQPSRRTPGAARPVDPGPQ